MTRTHTHTCLFAQRVQAQPQLHYLHNRMVQKTGALAVKDTSLNPVYPAAQYHKVNCFVESFPSTSPGILVCFSSEEKLENIFRGLDCTSEVGDSKNLGSQNSKPTLKCADSCNPPSLSHCSRCKVRLSSMADSKEY